MHRERAWGMHRAAKSRGEDWSNYDLPFYKWNVTDLHALSLSPPRRSSLEAKSGSSALHAGLVE